MYPSRSIQTKDGTIFKRILGQEFYMIGWDGKRYSRRDEINAAVAKKATYSRATNTVLNVRQYSGIVIAIGEFRAEGTTADSESFQRAGSWQSIFTNRDGQWVAIASHTAPLPE